MQAAIDANGKDCMFENKWCKLNILKIIKKQFDKKGISPEEKAFYLLLFLKTAGTHRNTNSFFQSPGTETASIQAFKNSLGTHSSSDLSNFIDTTIIGVLNDDKKLRGLKKN
ncbi:MAG TPA: hypothetical protein DCZ80_05665 [Legionellales bacterium]|nr:hypothetical protein [Legionellales bacterium]